MNHEWKRKLSKWLVGCYIMTCFGTLPVFAAEDTGMTVHEPAAATETLGSNLIQDGSFENAALGTVPSWCNVTTGTAEVVDTKASDGTKSVKLIHEYNEKGNELSFNIFHEFTAGKKYKATVDVRLDESFGDDTTSGFYFTPMGAEVSGSRIDSPALNGSDGFVTMEIEITANQTAKGRIKVGVIGKSTPEKTVIGYVDNVTLREVMTVSPTDTPDNILSDGSFEKAAEGTIVTGTTENKMSVYNGQGKVVKTKHSDGMQSMMLTHKANTDVLSFSYYVDFEAGKTYEATVDVRYDDSMGDVPAAGFYFVARDSGGAFISSQANSGSMKGTEDFKTLKVQFTAETSGTGRLNIGTGAKSTEVMTVIGYVDNMTLREISSMPTEKPTETPTEKPSGDLVADGGFETAAEGTPLNSDKAGFFGAGNASAAVVSKPNTDAKYIRTGNHAAKVTQLSTSKGEGSLNYRFYPIGGRKYRITAYVRYDEGVDFSTGKNPYGSFYMRLADTTNDAAFYAKKVMTSQMTGISDFEKLEFEVTLAAEDIRDDKPMRINISSNAGEEGKRLGETFYVDDVSCIDVTDEKPSPTDEPKPTDQPKPTDNPEEGEKISDGGFENYRVGTNLISASPFSITGVTEGGVTESYAYEGKKSLKVKRDAAIDDSQQVGVNYAVKFEAGKSYLLSARVRYEPGTALGEWYIRPNGVSDFDFANRGSAKIDGNAGFTEIRVIYNCSVTASGRFNVGMSGLGTTTGYLDNLSCIELGAPFTLKDAVWNSVAEENGISVCPINAEVILTFTGNMQQETLNAGSLLLNGRENSGDRIVVSVDPAKKNEVKVLLRNLGYGTHYQLSLKSDSTWTDQFSRKQTFEPISFKTCGRVSVGTKKLYLNGNEITNGKLAVGKIKGEISGLKNVCGETSNASVVLALFKNGEMVDAVSSTGAIMPDENGSARVYAEIDVPSISDGSYELKFFIWDDLKSGISLAEGISLK